MNGQPATLFGNDLLRPLLLMSTILIAIVAVGLYFHARSFDPAKMIGCYQGAETPLVQVTPNGVIVAQHPPLGLQAKLTQNNLGYVLDMNPGMSLREAAGELVVEPNSRIRWVRVDVRKRDHVPVLRLTTDKRTMKVLPQVPCD